MHISNYTPITVSRFAGTYIVLISVYSHIFLFGFLSSVNIISPFLSRSLSLSLPFCLSCAHLQFVVTINLLAASNLILSVVVLELLVRLATG